jgi:hypothetical protein
VSRLDLLEALGERLIVGVDLGRPGDVARRGVVAATGLGRRSNWVEGQPSRSGRHNEQPRSTYCFSNGILYLPVVGWLRANWPSSEGLCVAPGSGLARRDGSRNERSATGSPRPDLATTLEQDALGRLFPQRLLDLDRKLWRGKVDELLSAGVDGHEEKRRNGERKSVISI